jgi:tRNA modification GTPase
VWNKSDAATQDILAVSHEGMVISAKTGDGLERLRQQLLNIVGWQSAPEGVFMARERHVQALQEVSIQLKAANDQLTANHPALDLLAEDLRQAQIALAQITGEFTPDDLLGEIFSKFCIGK